MHGNTHRNNTPHERELKTFSKGKVFLEKMARPGGQFAERSSDAPAYYYQFQ